jgi:hypothetical protein
MAGNPSFFTFLSTSLLGLFAGGQNSVDDVRRSERMKYFIDLDCWLVFIVAGKSVLTDVLA